MRSRVKTLRAVTTQCQGCLNTEILKNFQKHFQKQGLELDIEAASLFHHLLHINDSNFSNSLHRRENFSMFVFSSFSLGVLLSSLRKKEKDEKEEKKDEDEVMYLIGNAGVFPFFQNFFLDYISLHEIINHFQQLNST